LIHRIYPVKQYFIKFKSDIDVNCAFCDSCPETVVHLFWHCPFVRPFWQNVCDFITRNIEDQFMLLWKHILFGIWENSRIKHNQIYLINFILSMAKLYVHKCKFSCKKKLILLYLGKKLSFILIHSDFL